VLVDTYLVFIISKSGNGASLQTLKPPVTAIAASPTGWHAQIEASSIKNQKRPLWGYSNFAFELYDSTQPKSLLKVNAPDLTDLPETRRIDLVVTLPDG
jgi:hypothetical protein